MCGKLLFTKPSLHFLTHHPAKCPFKIQSVIFFLTLVPQSSCWLTFLSVLSYPFPFFPFFPSISFSALSTQSILKPSTKDVLISFLPLAHMFGRVFEVMQCLTRVGVCLPQVHCMLNLHDIHMSYLPLAHMFERVVEVRTGTDRMTRSWNPLFHFTLVKTETARIDHPLYQNLSFNLVLWL